MFAKIIFLLAGVFIQELVVLNAVLFATLQGTYPALLVHTLFVIATIIDIVVGFYVGKYLRKKTIHTRVTSYIQEQSKRFSFKKNKHHRWLILFLLGNFSFPYLNAAIAGYLDVPFWESAFFNFLGNMVFYVSLWFLVTAVSSVIKNIYVAFAIIVAAVIIVTMVVRIIEKRKEKKEHLGV